jgi:hypothetical protein
VAAVGNVTAAALGSRWTALDFHAEQSRLWRSRARFKVIVAGRRSGKTELVKRMGVRRALSETRLPDCRVVFSAPTREQAKRIYWNDLKDLVPRQWRDGKPAEVELTIRLANGAQLEVIGMDKPERAEGTPIDWIALDEFADMKPDAWTRSVRPAVDTRGRPGDVIFLGKPKLGRRHFKDLHDRARTHVADDDLAGEWDAFGWPSTDILSPAAILSAKRDLDDLSFRQEYLGEWVTAEGRVYYTFSREAHDKPVRALYDKRAPLIIGLDFNVDPGVAAIGQDIRLPAEWLLRWPWLDPVCLCWIGEVHIPRGSNTPAVCRKLGTDWGAHEGQVLVYGDATGGARKTSQTEGSDWQLVRDYLGPAFGGRMKLMVGRSNPRERDRVNSVTARFRTADGVAHMLVDCAHAPKLAEDFDGVQWLKGGDEVDKGSDPSLTHLSDGAGYVVHARHPIGGGSSSENEM